MSDKTVYIKAGTGPLFLLFLVFLVLKLTGVIVWSWWWVTAPLWGPIALWFGILAAFGIFAALVMLCAAVVQGVLYLTGK
jgi:hypothetical protein